MVVKHHPPDMAGGCFEMGMAAVPYCQEIKPNKSYRRKAVDPPDINESHNHRRSIHASRCGLERLEEDSYEGSRGSALRSVDSPERNIISTSRQSPILSHNYNKKTLPQDRSYILTINWIDTNSITCRRSKHL
mmetsp:Transcript_1266/g.2694  ORF Transcript_1266/g.2694 Transcript_1266/m.2694 type:complete len:133 (-) Transcript_1266:270-668(-)